jgi:hypothetical protein
MHHCLTAYLVFLGSQAQLAVGIRLNRSVVCPVLDIRCWHSLEWQVVKLQCAPEFMFVNVFFLPLFSHILSFRFSPFSFSSCSFFICSFSFFLVYL